jgi:hypothetical protein
MFNNINPVNFAQAISTLNTSPSYPFQEYQNPCESDSNMEYGNQFENAMNTVSSIKKSQLSYNDDDMIYRDQ